MDVQQIVSDVSTVILVLGTMLNLIFIYTIRNGTRSTVSNVYKNIMTCFAVFNIIFAAAEFIIRPGIHIYGNSLMAFSHRAFQQVKPWGHILLSIFIGMYGTNTALLTLHFVYRYVAVCRPKLSRIFQENVYVVVIATSVLSWGSVYGFITFYCFAPTENYYKYAEASVYAGLGKNIHDISFFCIFTHEKVEDATTIYWTSAIGIFLIMVLMMITFTFMLVCGIAMYRTLKKSTLSPKSKALQTQLLKALTVQALIPFFTSYLSRTVMYCSTIMGFPPLKLYSFTPLIVTMYTVLDPIAIMFFICDFRKTVNSLRMNAHFLLHAGLGLLGKVGPTIRQVKFEHRKRGSIR
uniref:G_PROTEIN_RECEP_F1_2 domain-containing protein n=1 Tax=Haemonchus contortus TaxID=6289 RepID=A0A7I4Z2V8_HAECO